MIPASTPAAGRACLLIALSFAILAAGGAQALEIVLGPATVAPNTSPGAYIYPYMCDGGTPVIQDGAQLLFFWAEWMSYRVVGDSLDNLWLDPTTPVLTGGPSGSYDNGGAWLMAAFRKSGQNLIGFYHAEDHEFENGGNGFIAWKSTALCTSADNGRTWTKVGQIITTNIPKPPDPTWSGGGDLGAIWDTDNNRWFIVFADSGLKAAVSYDPDGMPGTWYKYYNGDFTEPGLGGNATTLPGVEHLSGSNPGLSWNEYLQKYVMVWYAWAHRGVYIALSDDLIHWEHPRFIVAPPPPAGNVRYPTLIGQTASAGWSDVRSGQDAYLYYAQWPGDITAVRSWYRRTVHFIASPEADFEADQYVGTAPFTVNFTDRSTWNPAAWAWDFDGDGVTDSTEQNPSFEYTQPGEYSVTLTASNSEGSTILTKDAVVTAEAPRTDFAAAPTLGAAPLSVQFTDRSNTAPVAWAWDFQNDGVVDSTERDPSHTYPAVGNYTVKLAATSPLWGARERVKMSYVSAVANPTVDVYRASAGFSSTQGANQWYYYEWTGANYQDLVWSTDHWQGTYQWTRIWASSMHPDTFEPVRAWLCPQDGEAHITSNGNVRKSNTSSSSDGVIASVYLNGAIIWGPQFIAGTDGVGYPLDVTLRVRAGDYLYFHLNRNQTATSDSTVFDPIVTLTWGGDGPPAAGFSGDITRGTPPLNVQFTDESLRNPATWAWDFDDDGITDSTAQNSAFTYSAPGAYSVRLSVGNAQGQDVQVRQGYIVVSQGEDHQSLAEFSTTQGQDNWYYLEWTGTQYQPMVWATDHWQGSYNWCRIYSNYQHPDTFESARAWKAPQSGAVRISGTVKKANTGGGDGVTASVWKNGALLWGPQTIAFDDNVGYPVDLTTEVTSGDMLYFRVEDRSTNFYDGTAWNPAVTFTWADPPPIANFSADPTTGLAPLNVHFMDLSTGAPTAWSWDFDKDGAPDSAQQDPVYQFQAPGLYTVHLTASNTFGEDSVSRIGYINVTQSPPVAAFSATPLSGPAPLTVQFNDMSTNNPTSWEWNFDGDGTPDSTEQNPVYVYQEAGRYTVSLTVDNSSGTDTITKPGYIEVLEGISVPAITVLLGLLGAGLPLLWLGSQKTRRHK